MVPTQGELAARLSGQMLQLLESRREKMIESAGGWARKTALRAAWPTLESEIPHLTEAFLELVHREFGKLSVDDLLTYLGRRS